jgi:hypothetical protein
MDNEKRATIGQNMVALGATDTNVINVECIRTCVLDTLAYVAHFCDRVGLDPHDAFMDGLESYEGDFEDGPRAVPMRPVHPVENGAVIHDADEQAYEAGWWEVFPRA